MNVRGIGLALVGLALIGCYNRYKAPLIWQNLPYPYIQSGFAQIPCKMHKTIEIEIVDQRSQYAGQRVGDTKFKSDLITDNELSELTPFLSNRMCGYFNNLGIACAGQDGAETPVGKLQIFVKTITPDIRGAFWVKARGIVDLDAKLLSKSDTLFSKTFIAIAEDGDPDVPIGKYSAVTFEMGGKLVTATSLKRIADSISVDLCKSLGKTGAKQVNEI